MTSRRPLAPKRLFYVNNGLTQEGERRVSEAKRLGVCPYCWTPVPPGRKKWCGKVEQAFPGDPPGSPLVDCYTAFGSDPRFWDIKDWKVLRVQALRRDGGICVNCGAEATEVDHIVEIQDGGEEFDLSNLRSLCHACHVAKTNARRRWRSSAMVELELRERLKSLNLKLAKLEDFS